MSGQVSESDFESVRQSARAFEPDRYLAALLSASPVRADLLALAAFAGEIAKIPVQVREPIAGEIRIQWWSDALLAGTTGVASGNPVADAFADTVRRRSLPLPLLDEYLAAHAHRLYSVGPLDDEALRLELDLWDGSLFKLAARIAGVEDSAAARCIITEAAQAYGLARLGLNMPYFVVRGRDPLPGCDGAALAENSARLHQALAKIRGQSRLCFAKVKAQFSQVSPALKSVLLPVALVEPYLRALEVPQHDPARDIAEISPMTRVWRITRAHWSGTI